MSLDLNDLLGDWPHEPGQLKVRKILGTDGKEKIQLRIDLGLIQMETKGRPDGAEPHGYESLLEYHQFRATKTEKKGERYLLEPEAVGDLQQEGIQYYHRYIAFFQLGDYQAVIRDTQRNLDMFEFVAKHTDNEDLAEAVVQFTPYVLMMNTRAYASIEVEREEFAAAARVIEEGIAKIRAFQEDEASPEVLETSPEITFLQDWLEEVRAKQPVTKLEKMRREMDSAIEAEAYERAAELRDQIQIYMERHGRGTAK